MDGCKVLPANKTDGDYKAEQKCGGEKALGGNH